MSAAIEIAGCIRYQLSPGMHPTGPCQKCGHHPARGGQTCVACLADQLEEKVGGALTERLIGTIRDLNDCISMIEAASA